MAGKSLRAILPLPNDFFLEDCFAGDSAVAMLAPYFDIRYFRVISPDEKKRNRMELKDTHHKEMPRQWLLLTADREMVKTHIEEIKKNPNVKILATAHNSCPYQKLRSNSFGDVEVPPIVRAGWVRREPIWCVHSTTHKKAAERHLPVESMRRMAFVQAAKRS